MYNATTIKSGLLSLVGWRQNEDSTGTQLTGLTTSNSGLFFNDEHPLLTFDNLLSIAPEYVRIAADQAEINTLFTGWLQQKTEAGIIRGLQAWVDKKFKQRTVKGLLERSNLFNASGYNAEKDVNSSKIAGIELLPAYSKDVLTEIKQVGLQFDANQDITVYLFSSRSATPIQTETFTYSGGGGLQWVTPAVSWSLASEGSYYLVYDQSAITGQSINGLHNYAQFSSGSNSYARSKFFNASSFTVSGSVTGLWDTSSNAYTLSTNYGLNIDFSVGCDYTNLFVEQKNEFKTIILKQVAVDLLRELAYNSNVRVNRNQANADRTEVLYEIDGDTQGRDPGNMRKQLEDAINSASMDTTGIDVICLPCRKRAARFRLA